MTQTIVSIAVSSEMDVLLARQRSRQIAALCSFSNQDQVRISTVVSELARNIVNYAGVGNVEFAVTISAPFPSLVLRFSDSGPGIHELDLILAGKYQSNTGMGLGILSARRLMDVCDIDTSPETGTTILLKRLFPANSARMTAEDVVRLCEKLGVLTTGAELAESRQQNVALAQALETVELQRDELQAANAAVASLYAALDLKAVQLQEADVAKDKFLAILAHELRNPLSAIGMAAGSLSHPKVSLERMGMMGALITRQVAHMAQLVEDLLDVSRVTRGMVSIDRSRLDMRAVVAGAMEQLAPAAEAKGQSLLAAPCDLPCWVDGDMTRLTQVAGNLLSNAIRYTPNGGTVGIALAIESEKMRLDVTDTGIGIEAALLPRLFDLYVQAEHSTSARSGLGVGLSLVRSIVELHGGTVSAASAGAGMGSRFTVVLPLQSTATGAQVTGRAGSDCALLQS